MTCTRFEQLKIGLEHGRDLFLYHAGQRTTSLRFFFIALAVFVAAWGGVLTTNSPITNTYRAVCGLILSAAAAIITVCFWRLDTRNKQLVESSEALIKEIERELAASLEIPQFECIDYTDHTRPEWLCRYRSILRVIFSVFLLLSLSACLFSLLWLLGIVAPIISK
jgi:hypothetical protein